jgi:calcineurin-like phosphoesterase family protein
MGSVAKTEPVGVRRKQFLVARVVIVFAVLFIAMPPARSLPPNLLIPTIAAAGDISCDPTNQSYRAGAGTANACHMRATADLIAAHPVNAVLPLGDNQYWDGARWKYVASYGKTWGRFLPITYPAVGNHEYLTPGAQGFSSYFGRRARLAGPGYGSFDLGAWHIIVLNSNCRAVGGCGAGSKQEAWLRQDLAGAAALCTLAYWHHPRFSSGNHGNNDQYDAFWRDLYDARADVVLNGHDHDYERFAPQDPDGVASSLGIREFVVGTGGANHTHFRKIRANSEVRNDDTFGVLELTLLPVGYLWQFYAEPGKSFADSGTALCH